MNSRTRTILSGFALATSWTWCIGMFAPIVIGQLMGWPGILAFAIPNVLGCALFGYLRSADRSRQETRDHAWAMAVFSAATVAYQVFFAGWQWGPVLADSVGSSAGEGTAIAAGAVFAAAVALAALPRRVLWTLAAIAFPLSLLTFAFLPWGAMHAISGRGEWAPTDLALVLPTLVFGFMLSPNLDLTFHRARQEVPAGQSPRNFAVFAVAFASMLLLTCCYLAASPGGLNNPAVRAHIALQLVMTCALHLSELRVVRIAPTPRALLGIGAGLVWAPRCSNQDARLICDFWAFTGCFFLRTPRWHYERWDDRPFPRSLRWRCQSPSSHRFSTMHSSTAQRSRPRLPWWCRCWPWSRLADAVQWRATSFSGKSAEERFIHRERPVPCR